MTHQVEELLSVSVRLNVHVTALNMREQLFRGPKSAHCVRARKGRKECACAISFVTWKSHSCVLETHNTIKNLSPIRSGRCSEPHAQGFGVLRRFAWTIGYICVAYASKEHATRLLGGKSYWLGRSWKQLLLVNCNFFLTCKATIVIAKAMSTRRNRFKSSLWRRGVVGK